MSGDKVAVDKVSGHRISLSEEVIIVVSTVFQIRMSWGELKVSKIPLIVHRKPTYVYDLNIIVLNIFLALCHFDQGLESHHP